MKLEALVVILDLAMRILLGTVAGAVIGVPAGLTWPQVRPRFAFLWAVVVLPAACTTDLLATTVGRSIVGVVVGTVIAWVTVAASVRTRPPGRINPAVTTSVEPVVTAALVLHSAA